MSVYHINITPDEGWYHLEAVEDESIYSQAKTLDEAVVMLRDVLELMKGEKDAELRLIVPASLPVDDMRQSGRITCWEPLEEHGGGTAKPRIEAKRTDVA